MDPVIIVLVAVALACLIWLGVSWLTSGDRKQVMQNLTRVAVVPAETKTSTGKGEPDVPSGIASGVARLFPKRMKAGLQRAIDGAGRPKGYTVENLLLIKVAGAGVGALGGNALSKLVPGLWGIVLAIALPIGGFFVADLLVRSRAMERRQLMARELPELLDQMVIAVSAGLGFEAAMDYVSKNSPGPLANEMGRAVRDIQTGMKRRDAYLAMAARCNVDDVSKFIRAVNRANDHGVPISDVLHQQATAMRTARRQRAEAQAAKIPAKVTMPVMLLIMPVLITLVTAPAGIKLFHVLTGH